MVQTDDYAVMTLSSTPFDSTLQRTVIAAGHNEKCQTYELNLDLESLKGSNGNETNNNPGKFRFKHFTKSHLDTMFHLDSTLINKVCQLTHMK